MIRKILFATFAVLLLAANANAVVYFDFVLDPPTTAGGGSTSTQQGANRWHLYAYDNTEGSLGIAGYNLVVQGHSTLFHRSPSTGYQDANENDLDGGFRIFRSANNIIPMNAIQDPGQPRITGFGREASNFATKLPPGSQNLWSTVSASWGSNITRPSIDPSLPWLFLAEGAYVAGAPPTFGPGTNVNLYTASGTPPQMTAEICLLAEYGCTGAFPPTVNDQLIDNVNASNPGSVSGTVTQSDGNPPINWRSFTFVSYTPGFGGGAPDGVAEAANATFDINTQAFNWNTVGAPRGTYIWGVTASNYAGSNTGQIQVNITQVPEPATLALVGMAVVGFIGLGRRRLT